MNPRFRGVGEGDLMPTSANLSALTTLTAGPEACGRMGTPYILLLTVLGIDVFFHRVCTPYIYAQDEVEPGLRKQRWLSRWYCFAALVSIDSITSALIILVRRTRLADYTSVVHTICGGSFPQSTGIHSQGGRRGRYLIHQRSAQCAPAVADEQAKRIRTKTKPAKISNEKYTRPGKASMRSIKHN